jgi:hypothetical protein
MRITSERNLQKDFLNIGRTFRSMTRRPDAQKWGILRGMGLGPGPAPRVPQRRPDRGFVVGRGGGRGFRKEFTDLELFKAGYRPDQARDEKGRWTSGGGGGGAAGGTPYRVMPTRRVQLSRAFRHFGETTSDIATVTHVVGRKPKTAAAFRRIGAAAVEMGHATRELGKLTAKLQRQPIDPMAVAGHLRNLARSAATIHQELSALRGEAKGVREELQPHLDRVKNALRTLKAQLRIQRTQQPRLE